MPDNNCALNNWKLSPATNAVPPEFVMIKLPPQASVPRTFTRSFASGALLTSSVVLLPAARVIVAERQRTDGIAGRKLRAAG